jgi:hypothetical protein
MAQHDFNIANQSFPSFRTDLNNALSAINTSQSGTSRPSGAVAGTIWLDTTSATSPTLKYYDGADDISLATLDHSANTVNWLDSTVSVTGLTTTATGTVLTLSDSSLTSSVNLILQNQKEIRFSETTANGTNYVGFKAPASLSADKIWILPSADGTAGQFLKTDGAGNLSFDSLSFSTPLAVIGNATAGSEIRLPEDTDNGSNYVAIKAPDTIASNLTLTLPSADGSSGQVLQTNGSGVLSFASVSAANTPAFFAYQSSTQSVSNGISTKIQFQTEDLDSNNNFDSTTNYRFTPTVAGYYLLTACLRCDSGNSEHFLTIYKNNGAIRNLFDLQATNVYAMNGSALVYANGSSDYFEVFFFQNSGTSKTTASGVNQTFFSGFRIIGV